MLLRLIAFAFALLSFAAPAMAQVNIMDPFNVGAAMDDAAVLGQAIPYADGDRMKLDIYGPKDPKGPAPVVMFIYGGSWKQGQRQDYQFVGRALAANGFVVVIPDYRLYPEVTYPSFLEDLANAAKWIQDNIGSYGGDTSRFFIAGHSAGAYNAVMLGLEKSFFREYNVTMPIKGIAEGHAAEADARHLEPGGSQTCVIHGGSLPGATARQCPDDQSMTEPSAALRRASTASQRRDAIRCAASNRRSDRGSYPAW